MTPRHNAVSTAQATKTNRNYVYPKGTKRQASKKRERYIIYTDIWEILRFQISKNKNKLRRRSNRLTMTYSPRVHLFKGHNFHRQRIHEELRQSMRATPSSDDAAAGGDAGLWGGILLKAFQHHLLTGDSMENSWNYR